MLYLLNYFDVIGMEIFLCYSKFILHLQLNDLIKQKEDACRERDQQLTHIVQLRKEITEMSEKLRISEEEKLAFEHESNSQKDQIASKKAECER